MNKILYISVTLFLLSCGAKEPDGFSKTESDCICPYQTSLERNGYKGSVKQVKMYRYDVDKGIETFHDGRIEYYDSLGRNTNYTILESKTEEYASFRNVFNNCGCVVKQVQASTEDPEDNVMTYYDYSHPKRVKKYWRGDRKTLSFIKRTIMHYDDEYKLILEESSWINEFYPSVNRTYVYNADGEIIEEISVDTKDTEEFPSDSTYAKYEDGNKVWSKSYKNGRVTYTKIHTYLSFDSIGNWIESTEYSKWPDIDGTYRVVREIEYYE